LPSRISTQVKNIGKGVYHRFGIVYVAVNDIQNIIGQKLGLYYGTSLISRSVALMLKWSDTDWCEDHHLFKKLQSHPEFKNKIFQSMELLYVVRRHEIRASYRKANQFEEDKDDLDFGLLLNGMFTHLVNSHLHFSSMNRN